MDTPGKDSVLHLYPEKNLLFLNAKYENDYKTLEESQQHVNAYICSKETIFFTDRFIKRTLSVKQCIFTVIFFVCAQNLLGQYQRR